MNNYFVASTALTCKLVNLQPIAISTVNLQITVKVITIYYMNITLPMPNALALESN